MIIDKDIYALCANCWIAGLTEDPEVADIWEDGHNSKLNKLYGSETDGVERFSCLIEAGTEIGALDKIIKP